MSNPFKIIGQPFLLKYFFRYLLHKNVHRKKILFGLYALFIISVNFHIWRRNDYCCTVSLLQGCSRNQDLLYIWWLCNIRCRNKLIAAYWSIWLDPLLPYLWIQFSEGFLEMWHFLQWFVVLYGVFKVKTRDETLTAVYGNLLEDYNLIKRKWSFNLILALNYHCHFPASFFRKSWFLW